VTIGIVGGVEARSGRVVVLAGPGVIDDGAIDGLRSFAAAGSLGVANTWGAKGVFAWDSPHHLGTCGLQAHDFELLGFADADLIVTTGISDDESPRERFALAPVVDVAPSSLAERAGEFVAAGDALPNELYPKLAAVAQPGYTEEKIPLHPARAVADLGAALPAGGLVTAEPGVAGLWVARTFPTPALDPGEPRRVLVPGRGEPGIASRRALEAARQGRPAIAVADAPLDGAVSSVFDEAARNDVPLVLVVWEPDAELGGAADHLALLKAALAGGGPSVIEVPVAIEDTTRLVAAAGAVMAWGGLDRTFRVASSGGGR
jgi:thiamine pyrophosphate-dependent acetolactate synthase large subunit-like protein